MTSHYLLSVMVIAALALAIGGGRMVYRATDRRKGWLMIVAAIVLVANVAIAAWPLQG